MAEYLLWQGKIQSHKENRPVDGMEADNVLSDQMEVCRPVFFKQISVIAVTVIAKASDIVGQCIQPHIGHMFRIKGNRDSPAEGGPGYAQILKTGKKEIIHHLIFPGHWLDKLRMAVNMLNKPGRVFAHTEKVCFLLSRLHRASAVRAFSIH